MKGIREALVKELRVIGTACVVMSLLFFSLGVANTALADTSYFNFTADHPWVGDYQGSLPLCWAAADSNALAWTGWGFCTNSQDIFNVYAANFNGGGVPSQGMWWYFHQYWPGVDLNAYYDSVQTFSQPAIEQAIAEQHAIVLSLWNDRASTGHAVTLWGYDENAAGVMDAVWVTNNWNPTPGLERWSVVDGDLQWGGYRWWYFDELDIKPVAEPGVWVLLGLGIMGIAGLKKKVHESD